MTPYDTLRVVRLRSADGKLSFNTTTGESTSKYEVAFWARNDGDDKEVIMNTKDPLTKLKLTSTWQKFTIERYVTGVTSTALGIDFYNTLYPAVDNTTGFVVYIDELTVKQRQIAYTSAATNITVNSFTANWSAVAGANSYSVIVEKTDGAVTPIWTPVAGSPFIAGNVQTLAVNNLDAGTYRYRVVATDGTINTVESNNTFATLTVSGLNDISIKSLSVAHGNVSVTTDAGNIIDIFNVSGQKIESIICTRNITEYQLQNKGIYVVRVNSDVRKVIF